jgi:hypothetical protein
MSHKGVLYHAENKGGYRNMKTKCNREEGTGRGLGEGDVQYFGVVTTQFKANYC